MSIVTLSEKVRGYSHLKSKVRCQDRYRVKKRPEGTIISVADGHGSKKCVYSHEGAEIATEVFCDILIDLCKTYSNDHEGLRQFLTRNREEVIPKKIVQQWRIRVENHHLKKHGEEKFSFSLYGTTLLGLFITDDFYFAVQLGDGDIICVDRNNNTDYVIKPEKLLGTETYSISSKDAWRFMQSSMNFFSGDRTRFPVLFMVSTDGYSNSFLTGEEFMKSGGEYFKLIDTYGTVRIKENLKSWLREISHDGCGDDIAMVLAYNKVEENA